jgi:hypothetical protein
MKKKPEQCEVPHCHNAWYYTWCGHKVCVPCFDKHSEDKISLHKIFNVKRTGTEF